MSEINLDDGKIMYEREWYSADELSGMIQEKMDSGEMKFAGIAAALEELNHALEDSHTLEIKMVITKADYQKLKELGGDEDREAVRKAIAAAIGADDQTENHAQHRTIHRHFPSFSSSKLKTMALSFGSGIREDSGVPRLPRSLMTSAR